MSGDRCCRATLAGYTLVEVLVALAILALLSTVGWRSLAAVLEARERLAAEAARWQAVAAFFDRFAHEAGRALERPVRATGGPRPAWEGDAATGVSFSRGASDAAGGAAARVAYLLAADGTLLRRAWPALDARDSDAVDQLALSGVAWLGIDYLGGDGRWWPSWPVDGEAALPRAVRLRLALVGPSVPDSERPGAAASPPAAARLVERIVAVAP